MTEIETLVMTEIETLVRNGSSQTQAIFCNAVQVLAFGNEGQISRVFEFAALMEGNKVSHDEVLRELTKMAFAVKQERYAAEVAA
ncbi:MAG: hypothetical protein V4751_11570 [Pseudomonadota bacterium]